MITVNAYLIGQILSKINRNNYMTVIDNVLFSMIKLLLNLRAKMKSGKSGNLWEFDNFLIFTIN